MNKPALGLAGCNQQEKNTAPSHNRTGGMIFLGYFFGSLLKKHFLG